MLPQKWCVKRTKETAQEINKYFNSLNSDYGYSWIPENNDYDYMHSEFVDAYSKSSPHSKFGLGEKSKVKDFEQISFETFMNEVVNKGVDNIVIEVLDIEHGKKVIQYFKSLGIDIKDYVGYNTKKENESHRYYGVINKWFNNYTLDDVQINNAKIITLPEETKSQTMKTTRVKLLSILNKDNCSEFNEEIKLNLQQAFDKTDNEEFEVLQTSLEKIHRCTSNQLQLLKSINIEKQEEIDYDRLKTGSVVMIKHSCNHYDGLNKIDVNKPVDIVFYKTEHFINNKKTFYKEGLHYSYITFHQNGNFVLFASGTQIDYITKVIQY